MAGRKKRADFGRTTNLEKIRRERGLSQMALAEKSRVSRRTIASIENREPKSIKPETAEMLAAALDCTTEEIRENLPLDRVGYPTGVKRR